MCVLWLVVWLVAAVLLGEFGPQAAVPVGKVFLGEAFSLEADASGATDKCGHGS